MRAITWIACGTILLVSAFLILALPSQQVHALPEYSAQTGEPCASCHISPSGGGPRGPRGQAWVGGGKPGIVPDLLASLDILGVHLEVDEQDYASPGGEPEPAAPLEVGPAEAAIIHNALRTYTGN